MYIYWRHETVEITESITNLISLTLSLSLHSALLTFSLPSSFFSSSSSAIIISGLCYIFYDIVRYIVFLVNGIYHYHHANIHLWKQELKKNAWNCSQQYSSNFWGNLTSQRKEITGFMQDLVLYTSLQQI